ncbi:MAG: LptF/LptG family permease [Sulfurospirillum sp.]|nr:LptF/LptG family permease [Sulfurospirillum sp.]
MRRVNHYLLKNFLSLFGSLFFILFFITSVVFFIKIATLTSIIKINFLELGEMYLYLLPRIFLYTLPITFFIAVCVSMYNLSKENETIVLFTLGYPPSKIAKFFISLASFLCLLLIFDFFVLVPLSKQLNQNFIDYKKVEAKFNIKATEFGQNFSDWLVYINHIDENGSYNDVVMYQQKTTKDEQKLVTAKSAQVDNSSGLLQLKLDDGKIFEIGSQKIDQTNFEKMLINSLSQNFITEVLSIKEYWKEAWNNEKRSADFSFFLLIALFPLASIHFALSISIVTYRYEKRSIYLQMFLFIAAYIASIIVLVNILFFYTVFVVFFGAFIISWLFYRKKIFARY